MAVRCAAVRWPRAEAPRASRARTAGFYSAESTRMRAALRLRTAILEQADNEELLRGARAPLNAASRHALRMRCASSTCDMHYAPAAAARRGERGPASADAVRVDCCAALGLPLGDFRCRFAVASLHLWLTLVRLRAEGDEGKRLGQARGLRSLRSLCPKRCTAHARPPAWRRSALTPALWLGVARAGVVRPLLGGHGKPSARRRGGRAPQQVDAGAGADFLRQQRRL